MASGDDAFSRSNRASRQAGIDDRVVELKRPIGVVLNEDAEGNVYVETVAPKGNAARSGMVRTFMKERMNAFTLQFHKDLHPWQIF